MPNIKLNEFYGGISQDDEYFGKWQCIYSTWVSHSKDPRYIRPDHVISATDTVTHKVTTFFNTWHGAGSGEWQVFVGIDGVWRIATVDNPTTILFGAGWWAAKSGIVFQGNLYMAIADSLYSIAVADTLWGNWSGDASEVWAIAWDCNVMVNYLDSNLFVVGGLTNARNVGWTDNTLSWQDVFESDLSEDIKGMTIIGNTLRVYTESTLAVLDIGSLTVIDSITFPYQIQSVASAGNFDYVVARKNGTETPFQNALFLCSGLEFQEVISPNISETLNAWQNDIQDFSKTFKFEIGDSSYAGISYWNDVLYTTSQNSSWFTFAKNIATQGNVLSCLPNKDSSGATITEVTAVHCWEWVLYIGYTVTGGIYRVGTYNIKQDETDTARNTSALWISQKLDMWDKSRKKMLQELRIGKSINSTSTVMYIRVDWWTWISLATLNETSSYHRIIRPWYDFYEVEFAFIITDVDEKISEIDIRFDYVER